MTPEQAALLLQAETALATARLALGTGDTQGAVNRAYYACFYLARAALHGVGEAPKTHKGTYSRFGFHFIAEGPLSASVGGILVDAFEARQRSDYDTFSITDVAAAADLVRDAERFVVAVRALL